MRYSLKHANPCGVATAASQFEAYDLAFQTDPTSAFGGIIAFNQELDAKQLKRLLIVNSLKLSLHQA